MFQFHPFDEGEEFNIDKLQHAILFFIETGDPGTLGKTKLMKLLYYADFDHYAARDESITGSAYRKLPRGPVPKAAFSVLDGMVEAGLLDVEDVYTPSFVRKKYTPKHPFDRSLFTEDELTTLHAVAERWKTVKTEDIVAASHDDPPWNAVSMGSDIPYHLVYYRNSYGEMDLDDDEIGEHHEVAEEDAYFDQLYASRSS